jgi:diphthamide biosynthesis methyltransferase
LKIVCFFVFNNTKQTKIYYLILVINDNTLCIGAARIGWSDEKFITTTLRRMSDEVDLGRPLHSLVIVGQLHPLEIDYLKLHTLESSFDQLALENNQSLKK